jgi:hypothetical protein
MKMLKDLTCSETFQHAELLTDDFIAAHTEFGTVQDFFVHPFAPEDCTFAEINKYVRERSDFKTWKEMLYAAKVYYDRSNPLPDQA